MELLSQVSHCNNNANALSGRSYNKFDLGGRGRNRLVWPTKFPRCRNSSLVGVLSETHPSQFFLNVRMKIVLLTTHCASGAITLLSLATILDDICLGSNA